MARLALALVLVLASCGLVAAQSAAPSPPPTLQPPPAQAYLEFMLARRFEALGDTTAALEALKRASALDPKSAEIQAELAGFYARQNKGPEAIQAAERALTLDANNAEAHRMLGLVYSAWSEGGGAAPTGLTPAQMRARAIDHLTKILETPAVATDLNLQMTLARLLMRAGEAKRAIPILENIVSQAPFAAEPYTLLAEARVSLGRVEQAIDALQQAAELNPRHYGTLGDLLEQQRRFGDAAAAYEKALASVRQPTRDMRLRLISALLNTRENKDVVRARDLLKEMLMTAPQDTRAWFLLSNAQMQLEDLTGAEEASRKLLSIDPTSVSGMHALSAVMIARREYRKVIDLLTPFTKDVAARTKGRESDAALLLSQLAHAHGELGEHAQAVKILTAAITSDPLNATALNSLGYSLADRGERLPEAVAYIERALKIDPDNPSYLDSLGWALFKQGRVEEAEAPLRKAAEALPMISVIQNHLGDVLARRGKYPEAIAAWERALKGDGEDVDRAAVEKKILDAKGRK
jgi:tetratricopeptide (TPR) repeat protein